MFDWKDFEDMFAAKEGANLKDAGKKQLEKKPDLITVVDPKKAYNCCTISSISLSSGCFLPDYNLSHPPLFHSPDARTAQDDQRRGQEGYPNC